MKEWDPVKRKWVISVAFDEPGAAKPPKNVINEYDPPPKKVIPLGYAEPGTTNRSQNSPENGTEDSFMAGCVIGMLVLVAIPFFLISARVNHLEIYLFPPALVVIGMLVAFVKGKRRLGRGLLVSLFMVFCLVGLLFGICAYMFRGGI